jgi:hypothetical protein
MKIIFIDKNKRLVKKIQKAIKYLPLDNVFAKHGDIFKEKGVIVGASNSQFIMGGGLDALIAQKYPKECSSIKIKDGNQRIGNIIFTITVDENIKSSRELVERALKFALQETKKGETILIPGLGTGIGQLDEDDFVWLFLQAVCEKSKLGWGIKYTKKNGYSNCVNRITEKPVKYLVGKWIKVLDALKDGAECGHGLHLGKSFVGAGNYHLPEKIFFCIYLKKDLCGQGEDKIRVKKLLPLYVCPLWLGYGANGKKLLKNIDKKINIKKFNPYTATKLPDKKLLIWPSSIKNQDWDQIWDQFGEQVCDRIRSQVGGQIVDQLDDHITSHISDQLDLKIYDKIGYDAPCKVFDQFATQVLATSYCAINIYFKLGITHPFFEFLKLGVIVIFINGKVKIFGKKGKYLGEYREDELK